MTEKQIKEKAKSYRESRKDLQYFSAPYKEKIERAYKDGFKDAERLSDKRLKRHCDTIHALVAELERRNS